VNLTTLESVLRLLEINPAEVEEEVQSQLDARIAEVSARAGGFCNWTFKREERVSHHDGGGRYLYLNALPVQEILEVLYSFSWEWEAATVYGPADYALINPKSGLVGFKWGYWPEGAKALRVKFVGGYDPAPAEGETPPAGYTPVPADLEGAICQQVVYEWRRRNDVGIRAVSLPDGTINKMDVGEWLESVEKTLKRYRIRPG
jgi:hypothetical protein